jgi:hypothetical protein
MSKFDFSAEIAKAKAKLADKKLNLIVLGPSGSGKSSLCGTMGVSTLFLYCASETHGPDAAATYATGDVTPICLNDARDPDQALEFLNAILDDAEFLSGFEAIAVDSASGLERILKDSTEFKTGCMTDKGKINKFLESDVLSAMFDKIIKKMQATGKHTVMTLALDVKALDSDSGEILEAAPRLSTYGVAETVLMSHGDVCIIGPLSNGEKTAHRIQFSGKVSKVSRDAAGQVKRFLNFSPRVTGVKTMPESLPAKLSEVLKLKRGDK